MAALEQFRRIRSGLRVRAAVADRSQDRLKNPPCRILRLLSGRQTLLLQPGKKAGPLARMARWPDCLGLYQNGVAVAIDEEIFDRQCVTGGFALLPQPVA